MNLYIYNKLFMHEGKKLDYLTNNCADDTTMYQKIYGLLKFDTLRKR